MKRILLVAMMGALCATASAGDRAGLAQSRDTFDLTRDASAVTHRANVLTEVQVGDVVKSGLSKVNVSIADQGSVLINEQSSVEFLDDSSYRIHEGAAVFHLPEGTARAIRYQDLVVTTIENPNGSSMGHVVLVSSTTDGRVQVQSIRQAFAVSQENAEHRLATVGDGDLMIFGENADGGWSVIDPNQGQPTRFRLAQDTAVDAAPPDEEDEEDRRRGAWWVWGGAALLTAGAVGGGYLIIEELRDDDDDDDEIEETPRPRRPVSPIIRPDDDRYFDDEYVRDEFIWAGTQ